MIKWKVFTDNKLVKRPEFTDDDDDGEKENKDKGYRD